MARLILEFNQEVLKDYPFRSRSITIGRQEDNTIVLDNPRVSAYHARIDKTGSEYILTDLQSTNGTFVNNQNVVSQKLLHGDRIGIGEHILLFVGTEKAKVEAETEDIPLNQTVMIGVKRAGGEVTPLPEMERPEFGIREVKRPRPSRRIMPIFLAILIVVVGGWLLLSHGPFLMSMIFERTSSSGTLGDPSKISDGEPLNNRMGASGAVTKEIMERSISSNELERPGAPSPREEDSSLRTPETSESLAGPRDELSETSHPAEAEALYEDGFKLDGIVWSSDAEQSFAVINGIILKVGGSVQGAVVTDIGRNYVLLRSREDDTEIKLTFR